MSGPMGTTFNAWVSAQDPLEVVQITFVYLKPGGSVFYPFRCTGGSSPLECGPAITSSTNPPPDPLGVMDELGTYEFLYVYAIDREGNESKYMASGEIQNVAGFTSHSLNIPDLVVESPPGTFLLKWGTNGTGPGQFIEHEDLVADNAGNIYVVDPQNYRVQKFDSNGNFITTWGTYGSGDGQFDNPRGVAVDSSGDVYVADVGNSRVQKFIGD